MTISTEQSAIKAMFKESLVEALHENKLLFEEVFTDVIEDMLLYQKTRQNFTFFRDQAAIASS
jgi:hypothetical protein